MPGVQLFGGLGPAGGGTSFTGPWDPGHSYSMGQIVSFRGTVYICTQPVSGVPGLDYSTAVLADSPAAYFPLTSAPGPAGTVFPDATGNGLDVSQLLGTATTIPGPVVGTTALQMPELTDDGDGGVQTDALWTPVATGLPTDGDPYSLEVWFLPRRQAGRVSDFNAPYDNEQFWMSPLSWGVLAGGWSNALGFDIYDDAEDYDSYLWTNRYYMGSAEIEFSGDNGPYLSNGQYDYAEINDGNTIYWPMMDGQWHHLIYTDDAAGTQCVYVDGRLWWSQPNQGTSNGLIADPGNVLFLGDPGSNLGGPDGGPGLWPGPFGEPYVGGLAQVSIYTGTVLSATRVLVHHQAARNLQPFYDPEHWALVGSDPFSIIPATNLPTNY